MRSLVWIITLFVIVLLGVFVGKACFGNRLLIDGAENINVPNQSEPKMFQAVSSHLAGENDSHTISQGTERFSQSNDTLFYETESVREHKLLAYQLGGWDKWLQAFKVGSVTLNNLSEQEKDSLFDLAAMQVSPAILEAFLQYGFRVTEAADYVVITGSHDLVEHEKEVLEKLYLLNQYRNYDTKDMEARNALAKQGAFYSAAAFGYQGVLAFLTQEGVAVKNSERLFEDMLKGRQPSAELFYYLLEQGYLPHQGLIELAQRRGLDETQPELFNAIVVQVEGAG